MKKACGYGDAIIDIVAAKVQNVPARLQEYEKIARWLNQNNICAMLTAHNRKLPYMRNEN